MISSVIFNNFILFVYTTLLVFFINYFLYYKRKGKSEFLFTNLLISAVVFQVCLLLKNVPMELGFALGLFAVFAILRFRTIPVFPREMTYLFVSIGLAAMNGLSSNLSQFHLHLLWNLSLVIVLILGEYFLLSKKTKTKTKQILYEKIDLLEEGREEDLRKDLEKRLSIRKIDSYKVGKVNFLRDTAEITVSFKDEKGTNS